MYKNRKFITFSEKSMCIAYILQVFPLHIEIMIDRKRNWDHIIHITYTYYTYTYYKLILYKLNPF